MTTKIDVYVFRGTGEKIGAGMCYTIANKLDKEKYNIVEIKYPGTIGPVGGKVDVESLEDNLEIASALFWTDREHKDSDYIVIGYSLGALAATEILEDIGDVRYSTYGKAPLMAVLIANPARNPGDSALDMCGSVKYGVYGVHSAYPAVTQVIELASGRDMITAVDPKSPIRLISKLLSPFEIIAGQPSEDYNLIQLLKEVEQKDWLSWLHPGRYLEALNDIGGYIVPWGWPSRTQHTMYNLEIMPGTGKTWTDWAVIQITQKLG